MVFVKLLVFGIVMAIGIYCLGIYIKGNMCHLRDRIDGKTVLITGANTGIGLETAVELARRGGIIHMACRNSHQCKNARDIVLARSLTDDNKVFTHTLDLASIRSILSFSKEFQTVVDKLDILINNAGVLCPYQETEDGFEMMIGVNHLGHFLLTNELLDIIKEAASSRILIISSRGHLRAAINTTDMNLRGEQFSQLTAYGQSKLANVLHAKYLSKMLKDDGITVVSIHPGIVLTEIGRHIPGSAIMKKYGGFLFDFLMRSPVEGAQTSICCAVDRDLHKHSGEYFNDCQPVASSNAEATNETLAELLWQQSWKLINDKLKNIKSHT